MIPTLRGEGESSFQLEAVHTGNGLWLSLTGDVDQRDRDHLIAALDRRGTPAELVIEASGVEFIGSAGLTALIHAARRLEKIGRRVVLLDPAPMLERMLDVCGIRHMFTILWT